MRQHIHPIYSPIVFRDRTAGLTFLTSSTLTSNEKIDFQGKLYPVIDVDISSASHPFWTGKGRVLDSEGRVDKFNRRYGIHA